MKFSLWRSTQSFFTQNHTKTSLGTRIKLEQLLFLIFVISLLHCCWAISVGWDNQLMDRHAFRQTQTAISTFYLIKQGFSLAYETPVLGFPWSIPIEFPLYQGIVAILVKLFNNPIDQTGRFVSAFFFYLSLIPIYGILYCLEIRRLYRWIFLSLFLASPLYLFWSRTFMIESTALFFSVGYVFFALLYFRKCSLIWAISAGLFAIAGGLTKITTLAGFFVIVTIAIVNHSIQRQRSLNIWKDLTLPLIIFLVLPFLVTKFWVDFSDARKMLNPMAVDFLTSSSLQKWNYGTIQERLSWSRWYGYLLRTFSDVFGQVIIGSLFVILIPFLKERRVLILSSLLLFILPLSIFFNLHIVHDYYPYANGIFLLSAMGFMITELIEKKSKASKYLGITLLILVLVSQFNLYSNKFYDIANRPNQQIFFQEIAYQVNKFTSQNGVILIYGQNWNAKIPYYSQRKALMVHEKATEEKQIQALDKLAGSNYRVESIIFCNKSREATEKNKYLFVLGKFNLYKSSDQAVFTNSHCSIYLANRYKQ